MTTKYIIQPTDDGSPTLYLPQLDEHYHSVKGAVTESRHVYCECGLLYKAEQEATRHLRLLEVGFGTGLNAALSAGCTNIPVHYFSLELYPLEAGIWQNLGYGLPLIEEVNAAQWDSTVNITDTFTLEKRRADLLNADLPKGIDVVYYDAFAPEKQPEMWSIEALSRVVEAMATDGVLTTYCAKGAIRRMLASLGMKVERLAGPPGGKREILRATKL